MSYLTDGITIVDDQGFHGGRVVSVRAEHADKVIQCYVSGALVAWSKPSQGAVEFILTESLPSDLLLLVAVEPSDAERNYWSDAMSADLARANRICVQTPQLALAHMPGDVWNVYADDQLMHTQAFFPGGRGVGGYGMGYGGAYGFDAACARGYGANFGRGEYGFDCEMLTWTSEPMPPGVYTIAVQAVSACGNESPVSTSDVTITGYARPASELTVDSYDPADGRLEFSYTKSEDIN
jgi:hypothetical protein